MKEITAVYTVELTAIAKMSDEEAASWERDEKETRIERFLSGIKQDANLDHAQLLKEQIFIRDLGGAEN